MLFVFEDAPRGVSELTDERGKVGAEGLDRARKARLSEERSLNFTQRLRILVSITTASRGVVQSRPWKEAVIKLHARAVRLGVAGIVVPPRSDFVPRRLHQPCY
jgi:hypothetical protein